MDITWLGHSCFRLRSGDVVVITDPFPDSLGRRMGDLRATAVTVSHEHPNHSHWEGVGDALKVLRGPGEYELSGVYFTGIMTPRAEGDPEGKRNTAYLIEMEGLRLCHLGDISNPLSSRQVEELSPVDVLLLPAGGVCTLETARATEVVQSLSPRVVIPMHYALPGLRAELGAVDGFLREMGVRDYQAQPQLSISQSSVPQDRRIVVMEPQGALVSD